MIECPRECGDRGAVCRHRLLTFCPANGVHDIDRGNQGRVWFRERRVRPDAFGAGERGRVAARCRDGDRCCERDREPLMSHQETSCDPGGARTTPRAQTSAMPRPLATLLYRIRTCLPHWMAPVAALRTSFPS